MSTGVKLSNQTTVLNPNFTMYGEVYNFFSLKNMIELFGCDDTTMFVLELQALCEANTTQTISKLSTSQYDLVINNVEFLESFNDHKFFSVSDLESTELSQITKALTQSMESSYGEAGENTNFMRRVYPDLSDLITDYEVSIVEDDGSLADQLSTPDTKLYYPEPFIASPSFVHEDLWFIHILHYQHWLWFMFISLIMFYFITFISVVRWCNLRTKPKRETRGVSRSKCADLITATVPVTWAASIIISESVDAADYYDGFGSGEIVIGIRAYQWGWEYFYPKGIDLNYNVSPSYSSMVGNSLKYTTASSSTLKSNTLWKYYQNRSNNKTTSTPAHLVLSPSDNAKILNFMKFSDVGTTGVKDSAAFKKIQYFSKTNPQQLYSNMSEFNLKYKKISDLYLNDTEPSSTFAYGTKRQHNFVSSSSLTNNSNSLMDNKGLKTLLDYNHSVSSSTSGKSVDLNQSIKLGGRNAESFTTVNTSTINTKLNDAINSNAIKSNDVMKNYTDFVSKNSLLSSENDSKQFKNPMKYALNQKWNKKSFVNSNWSVENNSKHEIDSASPITNFSTKFSNQELSPRFKDLKSAGTSLLTSERNVRLVNNFSLGKSNSNFESGSNNLTTNLQNNFDTSVSGLQQHLFNSMSLDWATQDSATRLVGNTTTLPMTNTPVGTKSASQYNLNFDKFNKGEDDLTPNLLKSKEESAPNHIFNAYWLTYWQNSNPTHRYTNLEDISNTLNRSYLPTFYEYAEYDFRNWQALELLEDAFWESTYSAFSHDDYLNILQDANDHSFFKKQEELFNTTDRHKKFKNSTLSKPLFRDLNIKTNLNSLPIFSEDAVSNTNLLSLKNFHNFSTENSVDALEDSYESLKYINYLYYLNYKTILNSSNSNVQPISYTQVIDNFRADYEENTWFVDNLANEDTYNNELNVNTSNDLRVSNPMKLRSSTRSAIVTYNAIQKVFKSRYDEGRSHARLQDLSNSYVSHPFLTEKKSPYEGMLAKNKESFFNVNSYKQSLTDNFTDNMLVWNSMNTYFADVPFLLSMKSDASRYLWFDWQSRWSSIEIQPSSVARYSLLGLPYVSKSFEYSTGAGDEINDSENYLIKLSRARKNYLSNWARTPYFYSRVSNWYKAPTNLNSLFDDVCLKNTKTSLANASNYWTSMAYAGFTTEISTPSSSGVNTAGRSSWRPANSIQSYYYNSSILVDILTKREYLYRQYFATKSYTTSLPKYLTAAPNNPLLEEVKASYPLIDPVAFSSELTREIFYSNSNFLKFVIIKDILNLVNNNIKNSSINLSGLTNYLFFYLFNTDSSSSDLSKNSTLYKSQFRPMKKGVTNMIRLHATSAIAMPIETRLHILASSKDVIHSWSIPSAGIKIDCVPGYSSHRITIFLVTGIFWGQCMEICGRFHHWMPIIVYFMKKDLFFLWCTHFMHFSSIDNTFNMTDRQFIDHVKLVSYDKSTWVHEFTKTF
jgi:heme/copper-type cytochrome/quinol oxidase subunit 2